MIPNPFIRPVRRISLISIWITFLVILFHGLTVWAVMSLDSPELSKIEMSEPVAIQLELITLPTKEDNAQSQLQSEPQAQLKPQQQESQVEVVTPVEKIKPSLLYVENTEAIEQIKSKPKEEPLDLTDEKSKLKTKSKLEQESHSDEESDAEADIRQEESEANILAQVLIIQESQVIKKGTGSNAVDLDAIIRRLKADFNRDQDRQWQEALKRAERESRLSNPTQLSQKQKLVDAKDKPVPFLEEQVSWLNEQPPITDLPSAIWDKTDTKTGDIFTVLLELSVDRNGYITAVQVLKSSGNEIIDAAATVQVRAGQLKPFKKDGLVVNGIVPISLKYIRP